MQSYRIAHGVRPPMHLAGCQQAWRSSFFRRPELGLFTMSIAGAIPVHLPPAFSAFKRPFSRGALGGARELPRTAQAHNERPRRTGVTTWLRGTVDVTKMACRRSSPGAGVVDGGLPAPSIHARGMSVRREVTGARLAQNGTSSPHRPSRSCCGFADSERRLRVRSFHREIEHLDAEVAARYLHWAPKYPDTADCRPPRTRRGRQSRRARLFDQGAGRCSAAMTSTWFWWPGRCARAAPGDLVGR